MHGDDEWESLMPDATLAGVMAAPVAVMEARPRDVETALNDGDVIGARLGAARRLNQVLLEYEQKMRCAGLDSESMKVLVKGYETFEKMAGAAQKDLGGGKGDKGADTTGLAELQRALAGEKAPVARPARKALAVVPVAKVEDAEFVVEDVAPEYGDLAQWGGMKFAQFMHARKVLEMLRHGASADMVREVYPNITTWQIKDCRNYSKKMFGGEGWEVPKLAVRRKGGWYRGPHKERFKVEAAP